MTSGEPDFTKRMKGILDLWYIKGVLLQDPTIVSTVPISIENPAIAYNVATDRFRVDVENIAFGTLDADVIDRAARLLGVVYGSLDKLQQRATTKELIVQIQHQGAEKDPTQIRALTVSDIVQAYGSLDALQQRATTKELIVQLQHQGAERDPAEIRALTSSDKITVADIEKTATEVQISNTFGEAGNYTVHDPTADKKVRLKLISLELSADVDLGFRWGAAGTIYYLRTTAGPMVTNFVGCNPEGATDDLFILNASGACTVKGYCLLDEVA